MLNDNNSNFHNLFFNGYDLMLLSNGLRRYNTPCRRYIHVILLLYWVPERRTTMEIIR